MLLSKGVGPIDQTMIDQTFIDQNKGPKFIFKMKCPKFFGLFIKKSQVSKNQFLIRLKRVWGPSGLGDGPRGPAGLGDGE